MKPVENARMQTKSHAHAMLKSPRPPSPASSDSAGYIWQVQEILAERTSMGGQKELLVVWKTSWIPKENLMSDGPVMRQFTETRKWSYKSAAGAITLAVEPGTTLQIECDEAELDALRRMQRSETKDDSARAGHSQKDGRGLVKSTNLQAKRSKGSKH